MAEPLSERQRRALAGLAAGQPITLAAAAAGVHRSSLHNWLARDPAFRAAHAALSRHQAESAADLATIARAGLQALITDPAAPFDIRLRAIQTALKAVQALPVANLLPDLDPAPAAPPPASVESMQPPDPQPLAPDSDPPPAAAAHEAESANSHAARRCNLVARLVAGGIPEPEARALVEADSRRATPAPAAVGASPEPRSPALSPACGAVLAKASSKTPATASSATAQKPDNVFSDSVLATPPSTGGTPQAGSGATARLRSTPRNAACPCGSKRKFKRCCGKEAPPVWGG
ncbi:MAG: SEC-C metal-binding domain-containing protein [Bryobacteraceae bacterium]|jgi:hypothetical protein